MTKNKVTFLDTSTKTETVHFKTKATTFQTKIKIAYFCLEMVWRTGSRSQYHITGFNSICTDNYWSVKSISSLTEANKHNKQVQQHLTKKPSY